MMKQKPYLVGITGGSASGKTTFLRDLGALFSQDEVCILSQDNYYKTANQHQRDENGHINYDLPECIDLDAFQADITRLSQGEMVKRREYRFQHEEQQGIWLEFYPAPIVIIEGLFIFYRDDIFNQFDLKIFIDAQDEIKLNRRISRDTAERNIPADYVLYQWENHVMPAYRQFLLPYKEKADLIINNNEHFKNSLKVIEDYFKFRLQSGK